MNIDESNIETGLDPKIGLCGFRNIGNTCYMNSILQLLIHSKLIVNFLLNKSNPFVSDSQNNLLSRLSRLSGLSQEDQAEYLQYLEQSMISKIGERERKRHGLSNDDEIRVNKSELENLMENSLTNKLAEIINTIIYKGNSCITPGTFKHIVDRKIPTLRGMGQQDSHELLNGFFDNLIEETGIDSEPAINNIPKSINDYIEYLHGLKKRISEEHIIENKKLIIQELNEYKKKNYDTINKYTGLNYMVRVFKSKRTSSLDTSSTGYNPMIFNLLTFNVDIYKCEECLHEHSVYQYYTNLMLPIKPTLRECFEKMVGEESIERRCELCKCNKSIKKTKIWRPGMTLFIELCRFSSLPNGRTWKDNSNVEIPHTIDLSEFCDKSMNTDIPLSYRYRLKGISNHLGNMGGGHYTADCLSITDNKTWYHFDDSRVSKHTNSNIDTSSAYVLLYEME
jgi:ubiquitin C-terminal hydrolase